MPGSPITSFAVQPNFKDGHVVHWGLDKAFFTTEKINFIVQVSETPSFSEILYTLDAGDSFFAIDNTRQKQNWSASTYYRLKMTVGDKVYYSYTLMFGQEKETDRKWLYASEIIRKELLQMKRFNGTLYYLLKRKNSGQIDYDSVDPISGLALDDNVGSYGTGIIGGYHAPLGFYGTILQQQSGRAQSITVVENEQLRLRTVGFPVIEEKDIVVDPITDRRYNTIGSDSSFFPATGIMLIQEINLSLIPNTDTIYQITVP